jgi:hypothetical protein
VTSDWTYEASAAAASVWPSPPPLTTARRITAVRLMPTPRRTVDRDPPGVLAIELLATDTTTDPRTRTLGFKVEELRTKRDSGHSATPPHRARACAVPTARGLRG